MKWNRTGTQTLKQRRNEKIVSRYKELLLTQKYNATRLKTLENEFYISKQQIVVILKKVGVFVFELQANRKFSEPPKSCKS